MVPGKHEKGQAQEVTDARALLYVGTSGYSYKEWKGHFYPEKIAAADMLRFYSSQFNSVEINSTFYRMPTEKLLASWSDQVPDSFAFVLKASRKITHLKLLNGVEEELSYLVRTVGILGTRLGPMLFQLPPNMKKDVDRLESFLGLLPDSLRTAFEFRHDSWFDSAVYEVLEKHNVALVWADTEDTVMERMVPTADFGYLRLRREDYDSSDLDVWCEKAGGEKWKDAFAFFKHEEEGAGPELVSRFQEVWDSR